MKSIWNRVTGVLAMRAPVSFHVLFDGFWAWLCTLGRRVRASFVALIASPSVWVACLIVAFGAFYGGHVVGAHGKRVVKAYYEDVVSVRGREVRSLKAELVAAKEAIAEAARATSQAAAPSAASIPAAEPKSPPAPRKPAARAAPKAAPPEKPYWPWG